MALPPHQIVRVLRLIGSPACRGDKRVPLSTIANLIGLSRPTLCRARDSGRVNAGTAELLTPLIRQFEAGKLRFRRSSAQRPAEPLGDHRDVV